MFSSSPTFLLWRGCLLVAALFVGRAAVALLLQDVADEDPQQAHDAEDRHQGEDGVLSRLLLGAAHHRAVDGASGTAGWTFANGADGPDARRCWRGAESVKTRTLGVEGYKEALAYISCRDSGRLVPLQQEGRNCTWGKKNPNSV